MAGDVTNMVVAQGEPGAAHEGDVAPGHGGEAADGVHAGTEVAGHGAEAGHGTFPPFNPDTFASQLLWLALAFGALYLFLSRVALPRIGGILQSRRARIEGDLKEADRLRLESERAAAAYEEALAEARRNANAIAQETREAIRADLVGKRSKVEGGLAERMAEAEARISATKSAALSNIDQIAGETAAALVAQLAGPVSEAEVKEALAAAAKG